MNETDRVERRASEIIYGLHTLRRNKRSVEHQTEWLERYIENSLLRTPARQPFQNDTIFDWLEANVEKYPELAGGFSRSDRRVDDTVILQMMTRLDAIGPPSIQENAA